MRKIILCLVCVAGVCPRARADGLLYRLPDDGTWAEFELRISNQREADRIATVTIKSVGRVNQTDRWLEFKVPGEESTHTIKVLIPERHLKGGESPMDHVLRGWRRRDAEMPVAVPRPRDFWLLIMLAGPLSDVKTLPEELIDGPAGKLKCEGLTGRTRVREDDGYEEDLSYTIRRHKDSPFGVVHCRIECQVERDGKKLDRVTYEFKLTRIGTSAASELGEYQ